MFPQVYNAEDTNEHLGNVEETLYLEILEKYKAPCIKEQMSWS